jgi:hypothetical protein
LDRIRFDFFHGTILETRKPKMTPEKKEKQLSGSEELNESFYSTLLFFFTLHFFTFSPEKV